MNRSEWPRARPADRAARHQLMEDVASITGRIVQPSAMGTGQVQVYSLPAFDKGRQPEVLAGPQVGSAKTRLKGPAVLVGKLNPHIPRVWRLESIPDHSYCSPEFYALEPNTRILDIGYLYHFLLSKMSRLAQGVTGSTNSHKRLSRDDFLQLVVPVPSLEVQVEIAGMLDRFAQLEAQLEAEIEARTRQFSYYQWELTNAFAASGELKAGWRSFALGELCAVEKGRTPIQKAIPGAYPLVVTGQGRQSSNGFDFDGEAVCIPLVSSKGHGVASIARLHYQSGRFALGTILCAAIPKVETVLSAEFLFHYLEARKDSLLVSLMRGGANVSLTIKSLLSVPVYVPPIDQQLKIVYNLRALGALTNDAAAGIPAELAARRKQHEHYREKLLTFEEVPA